MIRKIFIGALMLIAIAITGCSESASSDERVVAVSFPNTTTSWQRNGDSIRRYLEEDNFKVDIHFAGSPSEQSSQLAEIIETKPNCIVIGALDGEGLVDVLAKAKEYEIPIIAFDRIIKNTDAVTYYASYDNEAIGEAMGMYFEAALNLKGGAGP